ncbi:DUF4011 domain-containing protein [Nesterenkonia muleiensis]|uniref:DUF4011 domain-containing protein n=1 Tax=Nesterenkonia muleiensis TaxID=2282648 RepID=UPI000E76A55C|nr:DUF4011 domain-containing protein [Nesterenkonia muleiensis]
MGTLQLNAQGGDLEVILHTREALNYSLMHNQVPLISGATVTHRGSQQSQPLSLTLSLDPLGPHLDLTASPLQVNVPALAPGEVYSISQSELHWPLSLTALLDIDAAAPTLLHLQENGADASSSAHLTVLPADQWWAEGIRESLAAFIRPQNDAVGELLDETAAALEHYTGSAEISGYHSGPGRVRQIVRGVYHVLSGLHLVHTRNTESLLAGGHRIRQPDEVLVAGRATTLELATLFSAAVERAGIHSVLAVSERHVLVGWLSEPHRLPSAVVDSASLVATVADSQLFEAVDVTGLCSGEQAMSFDSAVDHAQHWWSSYEREELYLLDVHAAHRRISPLPAIRFEGATRVVEVVRKPSGPRPRTLPPSPEDSQPAAAASTTAPPPRIENWRRSLLDLSYRNPLLRLTDSASAELHVPSGALEVLIELLAAGARLTLDEHGDLDDLHKAQGARTAADVDAGVLTDILEHEQRIFAVLGFTEFLRRLRSLQRRARTTAEETGADPLYVAAGLLTWEEAGPRGGRSRGGRAPLFLIPVTLSGGRGRTPFRIALDETRDPVANISLVEKLRADLSITLTPLVQPPVLQGRIDVLGALEQLRRLLLTEELENFSVHESAHLALAQFSTLDMWRDLSDHWQHFMDRPHVRHLVEHPGEPYDDGTPAPDADQLAETRMRLPVPADGSQIEAVRWAAAGKSFILEGPPGTGKSQTITNLIAECLHQGKKVLFVAEKQAALDVVQRRLEEVGLGAFTLDVHGRNQSLTAVREQIREALSASSATPTAWDAVQSRTRSTAQQLARYPEQLHGTGPSGLSAWQARQLALELDSGHSPDTGLTVSRETLLELGELSAVYDDAAELDRALIDLGAEPCEHPWGLSRLSTDGWDPEAVASAAAELLEAEAALPPSAATDLLGVALLPEQMRCALVWLQALVPGFSESALDLDIAHLVQRSQQIDQSLWPFGKRRRKERLLDEVAEHITVRGAIDADQLSDHLTRLEDLRKAWDALDTAFSGSEHAEAAARAASAVFDNGQVSQIPLEQAQRLAAAWESLVELLDADERSLLRWAQGVAGAPAPDRAAAVRACASAWQRDARGAALIELSRWTEVAVPLESLRSRGVGDAAEAVAAGTLLPGEVEPALRRALTRAALDERLHSTGLHRFDPIAHRRRTEQFTASAAQRRDLLRQQLPAELISARGFSPEAPLGAVAQLQRQIGRRRGGLRIRQLFEHYGELITEAAPCLLMSPDSVARFLPADAVDFDVVVFDEASQIRVPEAIGAMGRGRSVVIVGDTKQMPPTAVFAHSGGEDESDEALVPADLDSILSEAHESGLHRLWLSWHYRSKDESLIAFSNRQYYGGRLSTFPAPPGASNTGAVQLRVVGGRWEGGRGGARVNRVEAEEVLAEVTALLEEGPGRSIGVVTFNVQQRDLLLDMLEASEDSSIQAALAREDEPLLVKNLENVQGDERDAVIFTLAFSRDERGKVPLQWGSMTSAGGDRRLNVAITRARETVRILSSFAPHELDLRNSASKGLADLKEYMLAASHQEQRLAPRFDPAGTAPDQHAAEVHQRLLEAGLEVIPAVGLSDFRVDFAVRDQGQPWIAVLLDGPDWAARSTVGDRDALPQTVLTGAMGWPAVERIWLPEWLRDAEAVIGRIRSAAQQVCRADDAAPGPASPIATAGPAAGQQARATTGDEQQENAAEEINPEEITVRQRHVEQVPGEELKQVMVQTLRQAFRAPEEEILRSVARLYGHQRMGTRIQKRLDEVFQRAVAEGLIVCVGPNEYEPEERI